MEDLKIPRMETIQNTAKLTGLSESFIRRKVQNGEIVAVNIGVKYLVNVDKLIEYLNTNKCVEQCSDVAGKAVL